MAEQSEDAEKPPEALPIRPPHHTSTQGWTSNSLQSFLNPKPTEDALIRPTKNRPNDLLSFLAVVEHYEIDLLSFTYQPDFLFTGSGATSNIRTRVVRQQTSFVFKIIRIRDATGRENEEATYDALISEITVLGHRALRHHHSLVNIEGICFDVPNTSNQIWPVIVLEMGQYGNLEQFMQTENGQQTGLSERMDFCVEIASAVLALHTHDFVHGDIKPQNVVVFADKAGHPYTKLTDFGFTKSLDGSDVVVKIPKSIPWNAPEHHHRGFSIQGAQATDIYSLGLLCFWLLFHDTPIEDSTIDLLDIDSLEFKVVGKLFKDNRLMKNVKANDTIRKLACLLVRKSPIADSGKAGLINFFDAALISDPRTRSLNISHLDPSLDIRWLLGPVDQDSPLNPQIRKSPSGFQIGPILRYLFKCHIRVRRNIALALENLATSHAGSSIGKNAAFQLAICYHIGFGLAANESNVHHWLTLAQRTTNDLDEEMLQIKSYINNQPHQNGNLNKLVLAGISVGNSLGLEYARESVNFVPDLEAEIQDVQRTLGLFARPVSYLKSKLFATLFAQRRYSEVENLVLDRLREIKTGERNGTLPREDYVGNMILKPLGIDVPVPGLTPLKLQVPDVGALQPALELITSMVSTSSVVSAEMLNTLAMTYRAQGRLEEAAWLLIWNHDLYIKLYGNTDQLTLDQLADLSTVYIQMDNLVDAEKLLAHISGALSHLLGPTNPSTLDSQRLLAEVQVMQKKYHEAQSLINQVREDQERLLIPDSAMLHQTLLVLISMHQEQGQFQEAEHLIERCYAAHNLLPRGTIDSIISEMRDLAENYLIRNEFGKVEQLCIKALAICDSSSQARQRARLDIQWKLGFAYLEQRRFIEAEEIVALVAEQRQEMLGDSDIKTTNAIGLLAEILHRLGQCDAEEKLIKDLVGKFLSPKIPKFEERGLHFVKNRIWCAWWHGRWKQTWILVMHFATDILELKRKLKRFSPLNMLRRMIGLRISEHSAS